MRGSRRVTVRLLAAASISALLFVQSPHGPLFGQQPPSVATPAFDSPQSWFVELSSPPTADGSSLTTVRAEKAAFRAAAAQRGLQFVERYAYDTLWNGLSIRIDASDVGQLSRIPGVRTIYPVVSASIDPMTPTDEINLATALAMTGADIAQQELGLTGAGIRVAVMDTGIDYHHPDLGGGFGPGFRVEKGYDFVGDKYDSSLGTPPVPDDDPDDCWGHGTHVAGIIGANGEVTGVAPGVTFHAYKVFGCTGTTDTDVMLAAMERALADGAQVLNISIGAAFQWPQYPTAAGADRLVNRGMAVVIAIGNNGANGLYSAAAPGVSSKAIGVASFDNTHIDLPVFTISPDDRPIGYQAGSPAPAPPTSGTFPMARTGTPTSAADACSPQVLPDLTGHVALIRRGTCTFYEKGRRAELAGAVAVVIYNNTAGRIGAGLTPAPDVADGQPITIPVVTITEADGIIINSRLATGLVDMTWTDQRMPFPNPTGGLISSFSAYGLSPDLDVKPDIGAPGGFIRSTYLLELGGYATTGGTSMASPHVAGAVALLLEARPNTPPQTVRAILQNSAVPKNWWGNPGLGFLDNVHRQGAGMVNIPASILATTRIEPSKLALGESEAGPATNRLTLRNGASTDVTYNLSHVPALATGPNTFTPGFFAGFASVAFAAPAVTVPARGTATLDVMITAPATPVRGQYGGYLVFTPVGGGQVHRVPYGGFIGDYQSILVLNPAASTDGNPLLRPSLTFGPSVPVTINPDADEVAWILVHLDHQVRRLRGEVFDANTGRAWNRAFDFEYVGRNSGPTTFFTIPFDGVTTIGNRVNVLPNGTYVIRLSVLKALGDASNPAHWETWTSPVVTIARP